ncbi:MAG: hypothetical protein M3P44_11760 [Actinomycetota bacterium]|nr:hypothetical protein [Actinomycetota bacterium]
MSDHRRAPHEFVAEAREIIERQDEGRAPVLPVAYVDQAQAAARDAAGTYDRLWNAASADEDVRVDVDGFHEDHVALILALDAAMKRRVRRSCPHAQNTGIRPFVADLAAGVMACEPCAERLPPLAPSRTCDVCETRAYRLLEAYVQYGPAIFRGRMCLRCRRFAPESGLASEDSAP